MASKLGLSQAVYGAVPDLRLSKCAGLRRKTVGQPPYGDSPYFTQLLSPGSIHLLTACNI